MELELLSELRDRILGELEEIRTTPDYQDIELQWELIQPGWGVDEGPMDATIEAFMMKARVLLERVMEVLAGPIEDVRLATDPQTSWTFRHSAILAMTHRLPVLTSFLATEGMHDLVASVVGGAYESGSFEEWLEARLDDDDAIGDLARDALADPDWPRGAGELNAFVARLLAAKAPPESIAALVKAWESYTRDANLDMDGSPTNDVLSPDMFKGAAAELSEARMVPEHARRHELAERFGIELADDLDEDDLEVAFETEWMIAWFTDQVEPNPGVAEALAHRFLLISDFLDENYDRLVLDGLIVDEGEEDIGGFSVILLGMLSMTPLAAFPWAADGEIDYERVVKAVREIETLTEDGPEDVAEG